ncbi:sensor histidine kinase [Nocardioides ferulae]|uniref:sensor histidine kinase n=1 Tax=Nocardioides ferulae TaxID=2340821 RepID=UPI000EAB9718|nr:histidine kinase dimerization/phospho-acceptor domain-containing protein [Nocardioides ferulae]
MRERITLAFVVVSLLLLSGAAVVRAFTLDQAVVARESAHLQQEVRVLGELVENRMQSGAVIDEAFLQGLVMDDNELLLDLGARQVVAVGAGYDHSDDDLEASEVVQDATLTLRQDDDVVPRLFTHHLPSLVVLVLVLTALAGVLGYLIARAMSAPFRRLAVAAGALGRGRFELELPRTRIPEAQAIAQALRTSAGQLQERLRREQSFAEHASHHLRTPLTGLRLELEDLALRDDLPEDARETATRGLARVDAVNAVAGELVELSRSGALVQGAEIPLRELATQLAQRWADALGERDRQVTAGVEGALDTPYTPGPIEHVLDLVLAEVQRGTSGPVRLAFDCHPGGHLRVRVITEQPRRPAKPSSAGKEQPLERAAAVAEVLGGRLRRDEHTGDLEVLLPRR